MLYKIGSRRQVYDDPPALGAGQASEYVPLMPSANSYYALDEVRGTILQCLCTDGIDIESYGSSSAWLNAESDMTCTAATWDGSVVTKPVSRLLGTRQGAGAGTGGLANAPHCKADRVLQTRLQAVHHADAGQQLPVGCGRWDDVQLPAAAGADGAAGADRRARLSRDG